MNEQGRQISFLQSVDENIQLESLRELIEKRSEALNASYEFIYRNVPISAKQEKIVRLIQVASTSESNRLEIYFRFRQKRPISPKIESTADTGTRKQQRLEKNPSEQGRTQTKGNKVRVFTDEEIDRTSISVFEREKRIFWNSLAAKLEEHPIYSSWSVQEKHGILDTEWTLKFTELLKVEADKKMVGEGKFDEHQSCIARNVDNLQKSDFERMTCYNRIERLNKVTVKTDEIKKSIQNEEKHLHELFSKLKLSQASLSKCLNRERAPEEIKDDSSACDDNFVVEDLSLTQEQIHEIAIQTKAEDEITSD
jgi:hypothetical protein